MYMAHLRKIFMLQKILAFFLLVFVFAAFSVQHVFAGFGITPPYVRNTSLTRNSTYEQQILLVRSNPSVDQKAIITLDAPELEEWIEVVEGDTIPMPKGEQKVPMTVRVTVPKDADFKQYSGVMRIKTARADDKLTQGAVNISLGAQVEIGLTVIDKEILDFRIKRVSISDLNEGHKFAWLYFPGKIRFKMSVENTGNVDIAPSRVLFRIFDSTGTVLLEETEHTNRFKKVEPYATSDLTAELPTRLPAGSYLARYQIFNGEDVKQQGELTLSVLPYGTLQTAGYGFMGLSVPHMISVLLPILTFILIVGSLAYTWQQRRTKKQLS